MISISIRVFVKLAMFAFILGFIFLFVVYGYRFDDTTHSFVTQNVFVGMNFFSNDNTLVFDGNIYEPHERQINFYNLEPGCYPVHFAGTEQTICYKNNSLSTDVFVRYIDTKPYARSTFTPVCTPILPIEHQIYSVGKHTFAHQIQSAFMFNKVSFIQVDNTLQACNSDFTICKELAPVQGDIVCGNKQGLVSYEDGAYQLIQLK